MRWRGGVFQPGSRNVTLDSEKDAELISVLVATGKVSRLQNSPSVANALATLTEGERGRLLQSTSLPNLKGKTVVIVGRGPSSKDFQKRYPLDKYLWVGVNPGTTVYHEESAEYDSTQGRHFEETRFCLVVSVDGIYLQRMGAPYLKTYTGIVVTRRGTVDAYSGAGSIYDCESILSDPNLAGESALLAIQVAIALGSQKLVLCGFDYTGDGGEKRKPHVKEAIKKLRTIGVPIEFEECSLWRF